MPPHPTKFKLDGFMTFLKHFSTNHAIPMKIVIIIIIKWLYRPTKGRKNGDCEIKVIILIEKHTYTYESGNLLSR
jgi:hypothetical protein